MRKIAADRALLLSTVATAAFLLSGTFGAVKQEP